MERSSSYNKQLRKEKTVRAVQKKIRLLQADIDKNKEKLDDTPREIKRSRSPNVGEDRKIENFENSL